MLKDLIKYIEKLKDESPEKMKKLKALIALSILGAFYLIGVILQEFDTELKLKNLLSPDGKKFTWNPVVCLRYSLFSKEGWILFFALVLGLVFLGLYLVPKRAKINPAVETDDKGVIRKEYATYGSARKVGEEEAEKYYEVGKAKDVDGMIFGQFDKKGNRVCAMKAGPTDNQNVYIVGSPGTGKSYALIRSLILQSVKTKTSFAVVDSKGELIRDLYKTVRSEGFVNKIFNLVEPEFSDSWDCLGECFDEYGDYVSNRAEDFVDTLFANTTDNNNSGDEFFEKGEKNLLSMFVNFVLQRYIKYVLEEYKTVLTALISGLPEVKFEEMPKTTEIFKKWRYARNMYGARAKMWKLRIPIEEIEKTLELINSCIRMEDVFEEESRRKVKARLEEFLGEADPKEFNSDAAHIFIDEMLDNEQRWVMNKVNLKRWCSQGIATTHRSELRDVLYELLLFSGKTDSDAQEMIETIEHGEGTPRCTISEVYYLVITKSTKEIDVLFKDVDKSSPAGIAYCTYCDSTDTARLSWKQGLTTRLAIFKDQNIRRITSNRDIELSKMGDQPTAIWLKISDKTRTYSALTSLFFSFLISDNSDAFDHAADQDRKLPIRIIVDEAANVGAIKVLPVAIASIRSRKMSIVLAVQKMNHLEALYGEQEAETIQACCDYLVFLGSNDEQSAKFMETRSGIETIQVASEREAYRKFAPDSALKNYMVTIAEGQRNVYNMDEIWTLEPRTLLLAKRGAYVLKLNTFGWNLHPLSNDGDLPQMRTIEYSTAKDKYPYFDYCIDSFYCEQPKIIAIRKQLSMELPHVNLLKTVEEVCANYTRRYEEREKWLIGTEELARAVQELDDVTEVEEIEEVHEAESVSTSQESVDGANKTAEEEKHIDEGVKPKEPLKREIEAQNEELDAPIIGKSRRNVRGGKLD